jgi:hypothetical protein
MTRLLTVGAVAKHFSRPDFPVHAWQVRRTITRGLLPEPPRFGPFRYFVPADLPRIEAALRQAGYLPEAVST